MFSSFSQAISETTRTKLFKLEKRLSRPIAPLLGKKAVKKYHSLTPGGWYN